MRGEFSSLKMSKLNVANKVWRRGTGSFQRGEMMDYQSCESRFEVVTFLCHIEMTLPVDESYTELIYSNSKSIITPPTPPCHLTKLSNKYYIDRNDHYYIVHIMCLLKYPHILSANILSRGIYEFSLKARVQSKRKPRLTGSWTGVESTVKKRCAILRALTC